MHNPAFIEYIDNTANAPQQPGNGLLPASCHSQNQTNTITMRIEQHTLAFERWMHACNNMEELSFCNTALQLFLIKGDRTHALSLDAWRDIDFYLTLCMHNRREALLQAYYQKLLN